MLAFRERATHQAAMPLTDMVNPTEPTVHITAERVSAGTNPDKGLSQGCHQSHPSSTFAGGAASLHLGGATC